MLIIDAVAQLGTALVKGVSGFFERRHKIKEAETENRARLLRDEQSNNHEWEMRSLTNAGWKDDVLFYAIVGMYIYSAFDPEGSVKVFTNWELIPEWFRQITFWTVASVLGVKKIGQYLPGLINGITSAVVNGKKGK